jgi:hypothetical protein
MLWDARDGCSYFGTRWCYGERSGRKSTCVLINRAAQEGRAAARTFPLATFESSLLAALSMGIAEREWLTDAKRGEDRSPTADQTSNTQLGPTVRTLVAALEKSKNNTETRLRLRATLRQAISSVWLLVTSRGKNRFCAVQMFFAGSDQSRLVYIMHRPPQSNLRSGTPRWGRRIAAAWWCFAAAENATKPVDFRVNRDVTSFEAGLADAILAAVAAGQATSGGITGTDQFSGREPPEANAYQHRIGALIKSGIVS